MTMIQLIACIGMIAGLFMVLHVSPRELSDSLFSCLTAAPGSIRADINETTKRKKAGYRNSLDLRWHRSKTQHPSLVGADIRQSQEPHQHRCYYLHST